MKGNRKYLLLIPLIGIIILYFYLNKYEQFKPIIYQNNTYKKIDVNNMFYANLKVVFDYYNVQYKISKEGGLLVRKSIIRDKELSFNYTQKAKDTAWINAHLDSN